MEGLGPWAVIRGATFDCGLAVVAEVAAPPVADVLLAALLLLGEELHPATPMVIATIAIVAPLLLAAVRFIQRAPVDRASPPDKFFGAFPTQPRLPSSPAAIYAFSLMFPVCGDRMLTSMREFDPRTGTPLVFPSWISVREHAHRPAPRRRR